MASVTIFEQISPLLEIASKWMKIYFLPFLSFPGCKKELKQKSFAVPLEI